MKIFYFILISLIIGIITFSYAIEQNMYQGLAEDSKLLYQFINEEGSRIGEKYQMNQCSTGAGGIEKIRLMALSFQRYGSPLNEKEARKLIVNCIDDFLQAINKNEKLKPFLEEFPFNAKNIDMAIYNHDKDNNESLFPDIGVVSNYKGKISYFTWVKEKLQCNSEKYETYDEAVAILKKEREIPDSKQ